MSESYVVLKFGGTSVSNRGRWETIFRVIQDRKTEGLTPVVVCSAISGVSNLLEALLEAAVEGKHQPILDEIRQKHEALAGELGVDIDVIEDRLTELERLALGASLTGEVSPRLHARVLASGELMLTTLAAPHLRERGLECTWLDAREWLTSVPVPGESESRHFLSAACEFGDDPKLREHLASSGADVVITQGFIAHDADEETVLLGRGGSDTSAAYMASKIHARRLEIWTDVPGMYTANPRDIESARLLKRLDYDEAQELASMGAKVLHPRCLAPVRSRDIPLQICCTQLPEIEGTIISSDAPDFGAQVKAISSKSGVLLVSMETLGMWQQVGFMADAFACFKRHGLSVDLVTTSESNVTVSLDPAANVLDPSTQQALLRDLSEFCAARVIGPCAAVSLVGHNIRAILHQLGPALEAFEEQQIYLVSQAASDLNLTFVVDEEQAAKLVKQLHKMLFGDRFKDPLLGPTWAELFKDERDLQPVDEKVWWVQKRDELVGRADELPAYVYDLATVRCRAEEVRSLKTERAFFAIKANPHPEVLSTIRDAGLGFECVSPGEVERVLEVFDDIDPGEVLFTPNFAPKDEYEWAFEKDLMVTLDNLHPLENWPDVFRGQRILVRIDPGHGRGHHKKVKTAGAQSKFGVPPVRLDRLVELVKELDIEVFGLHSHVGSGIKYAQTWSETAVFLAGVASRFGGDVKVLNVGGGLGVPEKPGQRRLSIGAVRESIEQFRQAHPEFEVWMEPGRYLVAEAGVLLARVTQTKSKRQDRWYVGVETGMNSLIRPALYGAYHQIVNLSRLDEPNAMVADVVGPICETGDVLGHQRRLPQTSEGDVMLIGTAGAYGAVMGSNYNLRGVAKELVLNESPKA